MKGFRAFPSLGLALILYALMMTACGGKLPQNGAGPLVIDNGNPLPTGAEGDPYSQTLHASGGVAPYTWSLQSGTLPPGFTFTSGGILSGTPPQGSGGTMGTPYSFVLMVTDSQTPKMAYNMETFTLTINPPLTFAPSTLPNGVVGVVYSSAVQTASGGIPYTTSTCNPPTSPPYLYSLAPGSAPLPAGLTLNCDGTITGTPTGPAGTFPFVVQASDSFPSNVTANYSITITGKIQGNYAFSFNGYNNGEPFYMAGSFCADGNGNINPANNPACPAGVTFVLDRNGSDAIGAVTNAPFTGTYTVDSTTNLGTMMLTTPGIGVFNYSLAVSQVSDIRFIETDANAYGSGVIKSTTSLALPSGGSSCGGYAFGFFGNDSGGNRLAGAGSFVPTSGNLAGVEDTNDNGTASGPTSFTGTITAPLSSSPRGTLTLNIGSSTVDYAFYVVVPPPPSTVQLLAVQTDSGASLTLVTMIKQSSAGATCSFGNPSLSGFAVTELNAVSNGGTTPDISIGQVMFDGMGNITSYMFDENNAGVLTTPSQNSYTGTYTVDPTTARVAVTGLGSFPPVWYLTSANMGANSAFVVGTDPSVTSGMLEQQTNFVNQPAFITSLSGNFYGGTSNPVLPSVTNQAESSVATPPPPPGTGNGAFTSTYDSNGTGGVLMNQMFSGIFCLAGQSDSVCPATQLPQNSTGRMIIEDGKGNPVDILYLVSGSAAGVTGGGNKTVTLDTSANPSLSVLVH